MPVELARLEAIFNDALAQSTPAERDAFLDQACGSDLELRGRIERLLVSYDDAGSFMAPPDPDRTIESYIPLQEKSGSKIGRYKLLEQIGEGGFGVVFMAEQEQPVHRRVALKIIKLGMDTRQVIARFEAERQALAMMDHPNIAKVLDGGSTNSGRPYFVMELVKGIPITEYCDQQELSTRDRLELFVEVCKAVQHAHQRGIIHRDIKPSNVLLTLHDDKAVPKVIDFGIAKATQARLTEKTLFTEFRQLIGTPAYMSPEQAQMMGLDVDTRSDIYSLGVMLYELLTGSTPFDSRQLSSGGLDEMRRIIREVEPPPPSSRLSTLGADRLSIVAHQRQCDPQRLGRLVQGDLDWIVMRCLEKDRTRRYETANALARDIERYLAEEPVEASPPSAAYRLRKLARRHRTALRVAGAFVLLLLVATIISSWQAVRATRAQADALEHKRRADAQAAVAGGINQFFTEEVFGLADPNRFDRAGIKLVEALDVAASKIDARFPDDPRLRGFIRDRFGEIYIGIDRPQKAVEQLQKALELRTSTEGAIDPLTMRTRHSLGLALYNAGYWIEARDVLEAVLADQTTVLGGGHADTVQTACHLSVVLMELRGWGGCFSTTPKIPAIWMFHAKHISRHWGHWVRGIRPR